MNQDKAEQIEDNIDPIKTIYTNLINGNHKEHSLLMVQGIENALIADNFKIHTKTQIALNHIFASVYLWNNQYTDAKRLHTTFLANDQWCLSNKPTIESYLVLALVKSNKNFIKSIYDFEIIGDNFDHLYKAYEGFINPNNEEHFNIDLLPYYQKLLTAQKLYCDK
jgi:hypothetical protein